jgi:hypothetical protein
MRLVIITETVPGEDAMAIGKQKTVNAEVAAHRNKPILFAKTRIGKP